MEIPAILHVWVDADSCPKAVRRVLLRAARRLNQEEREFSLPFHFVAAQAIAPLVGLYVHPIAAGADASDRFIQAHCQPGDLVITRDIVFAEKLCRELDSVRVINDRGTEYVGDNVSARRRQRDLALELRRLNLLPQNRPARYSAKDLQNFAACLDRCLSQQIQRKCRSNRYGPKTI